MPGPDDDYIDKYEDAFDDIPDSDLDSNARDEDDDDGDAEYEDDE